MAMTAKIFWSGNSQAIRLPKELRFGPEVSEVSMRREGRTLILEPAEPRRWPESFWLAFEGMPEGFERPPQVDTEPEDLSL